MPKTKLPPGNPDDTEHAFYEALQHADLDRLMACWADDEDIVCVHPGGPRLVGLGAIRAAFDAMFSNGGSYQLDQDRFTATLTTRRYADGPFTTVFGCDEVEAELTGTVNGNRAVCMGKAKQAPGVLFEATLFLQLPDAAPPPRPTCPPASGDLARLARLTVDRRAPNPLASKRFV